MENEFVTYQRFRTKEEATELAAVLAQHQIPFQYEDDAEIFDPTFAYNEALKDYRIKLRKQDFERADALLLQASAALLSEVGNDYYLYEFTNEELIEVLTKSDEWSKFDYVLAQKILQERGHAVDQASLDNFKKQRIEALAQPENNNQGKVYAGYFFALLGGLLGIFIGWHLATHKKTLTTGERVYGYAEADRKHGKTIFILGMVCCVLWVVARVYLTWFPF